MDSIWSQKSSVNRDFSVLSGVIVFIALLTSLWVAYETFSDEAKRINAELEAETSRIDDAFDIEIARASYVLESIGRQIIQTGAEDKTQIAKMLRAFDGNDDYYSLFLWVNPQLQAITSSRQGVLETPIDLSDREYLLQSRQTPFRIQIGKPIDGRISEKMVIPLAMGLADHTGRYLGSVTLSISLTALTKHIEEYVRNRNTGFAIVADNLQPLAHNDAGKAAIMLKPLSAIVERRISDQGESGIITQPTLFSENRIFTYYYRSFSHPYIILTFFTSDYSAIRSLVLPRMLQLMLVAAFLVSLLWLVRFRVIYPVQALVQAGGEIARGNSEINVPKTGPLEIAQLGAQLQNTVAYIAERKRVEQELIAKVIGLKTAKDTAEINDQVRMHLLQLLRPEIMPAMEDVAEISALLLEHEQNGPADLLDNPDSMLLLEQLERAAAHLEELLHEIFAFTQFSEYHPLANRRPVDVGGLVHKCVALLADTLDREEVNVSIRLQDDLPKLSINELHLMHVVMHLLVACAGAIPAGGELTVEAALEDSNHGAEFALMFNDNGTGLDSLLIANLWRTAPHMLENLSSTVKDSAYSEREHASAAVLTKKIITLHNGRITIQNPPDKEAVITVYFQQ